MAKCYRFDANGVSKQWKSSTDFSGVKKPDWSVLLFLCLFSSKRKKATSKYYEIGGDFS